MQSIRPLTLTLALLLACATAFAQNKPSAEDARNVIDYYLLGQGQGPILMDARFCHNVVENECADLVAPDALIKGEAYNVWFRFLVPQGEEVNGIQVEFIHDGVTQISKELSASGSIRYRTWRFVRLEQEGDWRMKVSFRHGDGMEVLLDQPLVVKAGE